MSDPVRVPSVPAPQRAEGPKYRLPDGAIPSEELAVLDRAAPADATEAHLRWLESGADGPDPCESSG